MIAVVVINYKNTQRTCEFLIDFIRLKLPEYVFVVVDNESSNDSVDEFQCSLPTHINLVIGEHIAEKITHGQCYLLTSPSNRGFAGGNNLAARELLSSGFSGYILFSNNDIVIPDQSVISKLIGTLDDNPTIGVTGPQIITPDGLKQSPSRYISQRERHILLPIASSIFPRNIVNKLFKLDYASSFVGGACYSVMGSFICMRFNDFIACGMMDEGTFLYSEESILSERLLNIGLSCYFNMAATVIHEHSGTISKFHDEPRRKIMMFKSESFYYKKYKGVSIIWLYLGMLVLLLRILLKYKDVHSALNLIRIKL